MPVEAIHHFNICAPRAEPGELRDLYRDVTGLTVGFRPGLDVPGFWLYAGGRAVLHLLEMPAGESLPDVPARVSDLERMKCFHQRVHPCDQQPSPMPEIR